MVEFKVRKISQFARSRAAEDVIDRLHTKDGEHPFLIEAPDGGYSLTPHDPVSTKAEDIIGRYRDALHVLAK
jgi:hypothetical protein